MPTLVKDQVYMRHERAAGKQQLRNVLFKPHIYSVQMCELAPSWLCFTCFLGCQNHLTVLADVVSSLILQPGCSQLISSACQGSWEFLPIMVRRAAIPSAATLV